jgi:cbb3-type cytochrome oxidase subunit 3
VTTTPRPRYKAPTWFVVLFVLAFFGCFVGVVAYVFS